MLNEQVNNLLRRGEYFNAIKLALTQHDFPTPLKIELTLYGNNFSALDVRIIALDNTYIFRLLDLTKTTGEILLQKVYVAYHGLTL